MFSRRAPNPDFAYLEFETRAQAQKVLDHAQWDFLRFQDSNVTVRWAWPLWIEKACCCVNERTLHSRPDPTDP